MVDREKLYELIARVKNNKDNEALMDLIQMDFVRRSLWYWVSKFPFAYDEWKSITNFAAVIAIPKAAKAYDGSQGSFEGFLDGIVHDTMYDLSQEYSMYDCSTSYGERHSMNAFRRALRTVDDITYRNGEIDFHGNREHAIREIIDRMREYGEDVDEERVEELINWYRITHHKESLYANEEGCILTKDAREALEAGYTDGMGDRDVVLGVDIEKVLAVTNEWERIFIHLRLEGMKKPAILKVLQAKYPEEYIDMNTVRRIEYGVKTKFKPLLGS